MNKYILNILIFLMFGGFVKAQENQWQHIGKMQFPVWGGSAIATDSLIYIIGGYSDSLRSRVNWIQEYNPASNSWKLISNTVEKRHGLLAFTYKDSILIFGGINNNTSSARAMELWNFKRSPFIHKSDKNFNRSFPTGGIFDDNLYIIGGTLPGSQPDTSIRYFTVYNLKQFKVISNTDGPYQNQLWPINQMSVIIDSNLYVIGGALFGIQNSIYRFNFSDRILQRMPISLSQGRAGGKAMQIDNKKIMIIGGYNELSTFGTTEIIDLLKPNTTIKGPTMNFPRSQFMCVNFKGTLYIFGGINNYDDPVPQIEKLVLLSGVPEYHNIPDDYRIYNNFPNPFNSSTNISFRLSGKSTVSIDIYNSIGENINGLFSGDLLPGEYRFNWLAKNSNGLDLPSGIYYYKIKINSSIETRKMILLK